MKTLRLALLGALLTFAPLGLMAATPPNISQTVGVCDPNFPQRCIKPAVDGSIAVTGSFSPSGTTNVNVTQVGGNSVTTTVPVSGTVTATPTGTQNVAGTGAAGTAATGVVTVQGISSMTPLANQTDSVADSQAVAASSVAAGDLTGTPFPTAGYSAVQVHLSAMSATSVTPATSFDGGVTYFSGVKCTRLDSATNTSVTTMTTTGVFECASGTHFKLTQVGAGAVTAKIVLKRTPSAQQSTVTVIGAGGWTANTTNSTAMFQVGGYDGSVARRLFTDTTGAQFVSAIPTTSTSVAITPAVTTVAASNLVVKASAGNLYSAYCQSGTAGYCMVFNATSLPSDGAVTPMICVPVAAGSFASIEMGAIPSRYSTGITIAYSTTGCFTLTASATAFLRGRAL